MLSASENFERLVNQMADDEPKIVPMYVEDFEKKNNSSYTYWGRELVAPCHPTAGFEVQYQGCSSPPCTGLVELRCHTCKRVIGKIVVANDPQARLKKIPSTN